MFQKRGFTLLELSLVVALMAVLSGLVLVRYDVASPRQRVIRTARKMGRLIENCREKAVDEETLYAMRIEIDSKKYCVCAPAERTLEIVDAARPIFSGILDDALVFNSAGSGAGKSSAPVLIFFDAQGILPECEFEVSGGGSTIKVKPDPLVNEIVYDEK